MLENDGRSDYSRGLISANRLLTANLFQTHASYNTDGDRLYLCLFQSLKRPEAHLRKPVSADAGALRLSERKNTV